MKIQFTESMPVQLLNDSGSPRDSTRLNAIALILRSSLLSYLCEEKFVRLTVEVLGWLCHVVRVSRLVIMQAETPPFSVV